MDTSEAVGAINQSGIAHATTMVRAAANARKCWACGCLRHTLATIDRALPSSKHTGALDAALADARDHLLPERYECLGCEVCFPAVALNDLAADGSIDLTDAASCPTESVEERFGWPPLPGAYTVLRYGAPVAVCTLNDQALANTVARTRFPEMAIVGTLHTENLGIERLISNVISNPNIRFVVVCGPDSRQAIGHLPGQSLVALAQGGIDQHQRIIGAKGKRPALRNLEAHAIEHFRRTVEVVDLVGVTDLEVILEAVRRCAERNPGPASSFAGSRVIEPVAGSIPARMVSDPAGYFVIFPDRARGLISLEHYANNGVLSTIIEGHAAVELYMMAIDRNLVSRLDHAAYLGRELARAEHALAAGQHYVQDAAPEREASMRCGCTT
jgi:tetrahydromethanopterin S-methyltransferase subunit A